MSSRHGCPIALPLSVDVSLPGALIALSTGKLEDKMLSPAGCHPSHLHSFLLLNSFRGQSTLFTPHNFVHNLLRQPRKEKDGKNIKGSIGGVGVGKMKTDVQRCWVYLALNTNSLRMKAFFIQQMISWGTLGSREGLCHLILLAVGTCLFDQ